MARLFDGTNDWMQSAGTIIDLTGVNKLTLAFWMWWDAFTNGNGYAFELGANWTVNGRFVVEPDEPSTGAFVIGCSGSTSFTYGHFTRPSAAAWHHYAIFYDMSTNQDELAAYVDGVSQSFTYDVRTNNTNNFTSDYLNFMSRNAGSSNVGKGRLAEVAIWPGLLLPAADISALAAGFSPLFIRPDTLSQYWPLLTGASPEIELINRSSATLTGTSQTPHPLTLYPMSDGEDALISGGVAAAAAAAFTKHGHVGRHGFGGAQHAGLGRHPMAA